MAGAAGVAVIEVCVALSGVVPYTWSPNQPAAVPADSVRPRIIKAHLLRCCTCGSACHDGRHMPACWRQQGPSCPACSCRLTWLSCVSLSTGDPLVTHHPQGATRRVLARCLSLSLASCWSCPALLARQYCAGSAHPFGPVGGSCCEGPV